MNRVKIIQVKIGSSTAPEDFKYLLINEGQEEKPEEYFEFTVSPGRSLRLQARNKANELFESQTFDSNLIPTNPFLTIPVYKGPKPGRVHGKIQLSLTNLSGQVSINVSENSETSSFSGISKRSTPLSDESPTNKFVIQQLSDSISNELKNSVIKLRKLLEIEKNSKENLLKELQKVKNDVIAEREDHKKREKFVLNELQVAENNYSNLKFEILKTKTENKALIAENSRVSSILIEKEQTNGSFMTELSTFSEHFSPVFQVLHKISESNQKDPELHQKDLIIKDLTKELNELKLLNKSILLNRQILKTSDLDEILAQKLKNLKISGAFTKDPEQSFIYNGKKIILVVKSGQLLCKFGSSYKTFEEYMRSLGISTRSASHKRIRSLDTGQESMKLTSAIIQHKGKQIN